MKNVHKVVVYKTVDSNGNPEFRVEPGRLIASVGDTLIFKVNRSVDVVVTVQFPPYLYDRRLRQVIALQPGHSESRQVSADAEEKAYPYLVFCPHPGPKAVGASEPEIIIDN